MADLVVHVGLPKTGSTALQTGTFTSLSGVAYRNETLVESYLRWIGTAGDADYSTDLSAAFAAWLREGDQPALVSWQGLGGMMFGDDVDEARRRTIDRLLATGERTKILVVLRRQDRMVRGMYAQYVQLGGDRGERDFVEGRVPLTNFAPGRLCYSRLVEQYIESFGRSRVEVLLHEQVVADPSVVVDAVSALTGVAVHGRPEQRPVRENRSIDGAALIALRQVNHWFRRSQFVEEPALVAVPGVRRVRSLLQSPAFRRLSEIGGRSDPWRWMPEDGREQILRSNRELALLVPAVAEHGYLDL